MCGVEVCVLGVVGNGLRGSRFGGMVMVVIFSLVGIVCYGFCLVWCGLLVNVGRC